ncbi:MAG TPA: type IVB secretion system protein IcmH/DotU [Planctomycetota bacterium]|jgi:type VI secretion system protein ImpK|nr:type IVB secretion system protein IcmH/DotU [Planctomycetota bacterium]
MPETTPTGTAPTLADLCGDLLAFALQLKRSKDPGDAEAMRLKVDEQFRALETKARQADVPQEDVQQAKYAICAFVDEMILTSSWGLKESWADKPLQLAYFNDFAAGEEFYNRVDTLRGAKKNSVLEVYYLCLALGFRGKYVDLQGMEKKKVLMDTILREIRGTAPAAGSGGLSPGWQPPDALPGIVKNFPAWFVAAACGLVVILLFILLSTLLGSSAERVVERLK